LGSSSVDTADTGLAIRRTTYWNDIDFNSKFRNQHSTFD